MSAIESLLGKTLLNKGGEVATAAAMKGKKAVGLYFSAHWCPPCRGFTPELAKIYADLIGSGKEFEIVFISSDREEDAFKDYFGEQPWLALPYSDRKTKAALSKKYKVQGIPALVIVDAQTGELITKEGRSAVEGDPKGANFPWTPPTVWECMGDEFMKGDGESVELSELRGPGKVIGLYFSAHWCPPCKGFTPKLVETYNKIKAAGKDFEIVFVSSDKSMKEFQEYFAEMPWCAIPQGDPRKGTLSSMFDVEGIPTFVLIDGETGATINAGGRGAVGADPEGAKFPWHPEPVNDLTSTADGLNEEASLCVMMEGAPADVQKTAEAWLTELAVASKAAGEEILFFQAKASEGPVTQVRKLCKLGEAGATPQVVLLDIPDDGGYYVADTPLFDANAVKAFVAEYKAGNLERKQLG